MVVLRFYLLMFICLLIESNSYSQDWVQVSKISASDRVRPREGTGGGQEFGNSISIDGNTGIVGSWHNNYGVQNQSHYYYFTGAAYIIEKDVNGIWNEKQKLVASDGIELAFFGYSVSISGDYAIIGAPGRGGGAGQNQAYGAAYIFERNSNGVWEEKQILHGSNQTAVSGTSISFSTNVFISGDYAVVENYFFKRDADGIWKEKSILSKNCPKSIYGDTMIIGCYGESTDVNGNNDLSQSGAVYVMELENDVWVQKQKIVASDRQVGDRFGGSVSIHGGFFVVGAYYQNTNENGLTAYDNSGAAYIFKKQANGSWTEQQKIVASDRYHSDEFGFTVSINETNIVIGSTNKDTNTLLNTGAAYVFKKQSNGIWREVEKLTPSTINAQDKFGYKVAVNGDNIIVSAPYNDYDETENNYVRNTGSVYVYSLKETLDLDDYLEKSNVVIYPNPSEEKVIIKLDPIYKRGYFSIINSLGKRILKKSINNEDSFNIDISNLKSGLYFFSFITSQGKIYSTKFIKK